MAGDRYEKPREVGFDEFMTKLRADVENFEKTWRAQNDKNPDHFPMTMWWGDWYEQFQMTADGEVLGDGES